MPNQTDGQDTKMKKRKKKKKKNNFVIYLLLFAIIFIVALCGLTYFIGMFTPDVDVAIGNNDEISLSDYDSSVEEKTIDERLRWIQAEDELPSVGANEPKLYTPEDKRIGNRFEDIDENISKKIIELPKRDRIKEEKEKAKELIKQKEIKNNEDIDKTREDNKTKEIKTKPKEIVEIPQREKTQLDFQLKSDFRKAAKQEEEIVIPPPTIKKESITKVYVGEHSTVEEAVATQNKIIKENLGVLPFIKSLNNKYVVQIGSFSDKEKAESIASKLKAKGYSTRVISDK